MRELLQSGELILLIILAVLQLGRWSQKTEDEPSNASRVAREALAKANDLANDLRRHKRAWREFLNARYTDLDRIYARKREVELEIENIKERVTDTEVKIERISGV